MRINWWILTLRKEEAATLPAATMKSIISMVAPGKPSEKNWGEQCLMIVLTISSQKEKGKKEEYQHESNEKWQKKGRYLSKVESKNVRKKTHCGQWDTH